MCDRTSRKHRASSSRLPILLPLLVFRVAVQPSRARAQDADREPTLEDIRELFQRPGLTLGVLLQAVVDRSRGALLLSGPPGRRRSR